MRAALLLLALFSLPGLSLAQGFEVIVHEQNPVTSMTVEQISDLFLKKVTQWPNGLAADPVDLVATSPTREAFSKVVLGRPTSSVQNYWRKVLFAGEAVPPQEMADDDQMLAYVRSHPEAIGYVSSRSPLAGVRSLVLSASGGEGTADYRFVTPSETAPRLLRSVPPTYPRRALRAGYECKLELVAKIDERGRVQELEVTRPCDRFTDELSQAAERAVRQWRYEPARSAEGEPIRVRHRILLTFALSQ